jgi:hypothetical protein
MKRFFDITFRPFFVITGIGTAAAFVYAFWPEWAIPQIAKFAYREEYTILVQHWGIMVGLMGVFMVVAAFRADWRNPILIYSAVEKAFMVYVVLVNLSLPHSKGFLFGGVMDTAVVLYTIGYFAVCGFNQPISVDGRSRLT